MLTSCKASFPEKWASSQGGKSHVSRMSRPRLAQWSELRVDTAVLVGTSPLLDCCVPWGQLLTRLGLGRAGHKTLLLDTDTVIIKKKERKGDIAWFV